ncbi:Bax inhibitor-1/YccA family protein [Streptomonospora wellingtoniae]|uniref:Bax inhibitor-1/YccA family protein n=1 Tax=Streptomonospora wellingtoniae TaxID=3075544 RepID=A0ABU2KT10_9ACTN|nr:Bax inhibitor-1/YccA family protein [Streptomonospora sp. DSM 45055]MDT0302243.1 Bax inhibitor-1/YccA family protein [Streptomonospora sp. DSM 45055]
MRMRSSNPVLKRAMRSGQAGYGQTPYGQGAPYQAGYAQPYGQPSPQAGYGYPQPGYGPQTPSAAERMSIDDVVVRSAMTLGLVVLTAVPTYFLAVSGNPLGFGLALIGALGGLVLGLVIAFKQSTNPALILTYGALEGLLVGGLSGVFELSLMSQNGMAMGSLVTQAVFGTLIAAGAVLAVYRLRIIRVTNTFVKVVTAAAAGLLVLLLVNFVAALFIPGGFGLREPSLLGLGISLLAVTLAAAMLMIEFRQIEDALNMGLPRKYSWQLAFGLTVTLVWLYIEILRLLWILKSLFSE